MVPTVEMVAQGKAEIMKLIKSNQVGPELPMIAGFVRLAFHDCVGPDGCDGCLNHNNVANLGLSRYTDPLDALYDEKFTSFMSRADFYALASMTALEMATIDTIDKFTGMADFKVGRTDCPTSPKENLDGVFPSGTFNMVRNVRFFGIEFGLSAREVVALMGAHTLGRASVQNSGYEGPWLRGPGAASILNNRYYREFIERIRWDQVPVTFNGVTKYQWQSPNTTPNSAGNRGPGQPSMFLNTDIALAYDFEHTLDGKVSCTLCRNTEREGCCQHSDTYSVAKEFSDDNAKWLNEFTAVFFKMSERTGSVLQLPADSSIPPTQEPTPDPRPGPNSRRKPGRKMRPDPRKRETNELLNEIINFETDFEKLTETLKKLVQNEGK